MKTKPRATRRSLERMVRRWKREAIELRREVADANLRCISLEHRMRAAHASAIQVGDNWLATQPQGLQDIIANIRMNTNVSDAAAPSAPRPGAETTGVQS